jgi:hypothetical protein
MMMMTTKVTMKAEVECALRIREEEKTGAGEATRLH